MALVVADGHAQPAGPADDRSCPAAAARVPPRGGPAARSRPCAAALAGQPGVVGASYWSKVMYPGWAPGMKEIPFLPGQGRCGTAFPPGSLSARWRPKVNARRSGGCAGIRSTTWWASGFQWIFALAGSGPVPPGEGQACGAECLHARSSQPGRGECVQGDGDRGADPGVGVQDDVPGSVVASPTGKASFRSPRRALADDPPRSRALRKCSSLLMRTSPLCRPGSGSRGRAAATVRNGRHNQSASRNASRSSEAGSGRVQCAGGGPGDRSFLERRVGVFWRSQILQPSECPSGGAGFGAFVDVRRSRWRLL